VRSVHGDDSCGDTTREFVVVMGSPMMVHVVINSARTNTMSVDAPGTVTDGGGGGGIGRLLFIVVLVLDGCDFVIDE
jgi:hypothetical protein